MLFTDSAKIFFSPSSPKNGCRNGGGLVIAICDFLLMDDSFPGNGSDTKPDEAFLKSDSVCASDPSAKSSNPEK